MSGFPEKTTNAGRLHVLISVGGLLLLIGAWRFYQVRHLALPAWVDSVHHTLLVRILLEQGTIPATWGPYLPDTPFYYHFGFHASAALLARLTGWTGLDLGRSVLVAGQLWQVLLALAVYLLVRTLNASNKQTVAHEQAFIAMLLVGFVSQMPAFYVTWGRYTLLAGATLLILAMAAAIARRWIPLTLLLALTAITHHYILFLLALYIILSWLLRPQQRLPLFLCSLVAALLVSPWLWRVWSYGSHWAGVEAGTSADRNTVIYVLLLLGPLQNYALLLVASIGCVLVTRTVLRREDSHGTGWDAWLPYCTWTLLLLALLGPWEIHPFRSDHAALLFFLPAVVFGSAALVRLSQPGLRWGAVLVLLLWGMWSTKDIVRPDTVFVNEADVAALAWIEAETPPDATFLIDVEGWFGLWRGVDGGWWIEPLTGRRTVLPPIAYAWSAPDVIARYTDPAAALAQLYRSAGPDSCARLQRLMAETGATYYYSRSAALRSCPMLGVPYEGSDGVLIYHLKANP